MEKLVSVVIPIYNVEKYLDRCVSSVVNQSYRNLEIILVDDGSPDRCPQMCDRWAEKDGRIKVIHKTNAGLGMARNTGIENATGEYICFFDSDDYIAPETVSEAVALQQAQNTDLVVFGMSTVDSNGVVSTHIPESEKLCYRGEEILVDFLPSVIQPDLPAPATRNLDLNACTCLFSARLIQDNGWRFVSEREIISEDVYSLLELYRYVDSVAVLKKSFYYYCENETSLTHVYRPDRFERSKQFYRACAELCDRHGYPQALKKSCMSPFLGNTVAAMKQAVAGNRKGKEIRRILKTITSDPLLQTVLKSKKNDPDKYSARVLYWTMRHRFYGLSYLLLAAKIASKK